MGLANLNFRGPAEDCGGPPGTAGDGSDWKYATFPMGTAGPIVRGGRVPNSPTGQVLRTGPVGRSTFVLTTRPA